MLHWSWGLSTALILALVIWLNGQRIRAGWLLGAAVQLVNMTFGWLIYGQWTFAFLAIPAVMFLINWWRHPSARSVKHPPACTSTKRGMRCDRVRGHDGTFHVGFEVPDVGPTITHVWTNKEADKIYRLPQL